MKIAYDVKLKKVGCSIVQAALGGDIPLADRFDTQDWELAPTPDMRVYEVSAGQLEELIAITKAARA